MKTKDKAGVLRTGKVMLKENSWEGILNPRQYGGKRAYCCKIYPLAVIIYTIAFML